MGADRVLVRQEQEIRHGEQDKGGELADDHGPTDWFDHNIRAPEMAAVHGDRTHHDCTERCFSDKVFVISFFSNVVTATLLVLLGNQLGVGSQLSTAVIVVLGIRIFSNVSAIRRFIFQG